MVSWMTSKFDRRQRELHLEQRVHRRRHDRTFLPPDNKYSRLAANLTFRQLPLNSTLALRFTDDEQNSDAPLGTSVLAAGGANTPTPANVASFNGKIENRTYTLALASTPAKGLDTRLYANRYKRDDKSTHVAYGGTIGLEENEPYSYDKKNWGVDAFYRINRQNRVGVGYDFMDKEQDRFDFDKSEEKKWFAEWKTTIVESVSAA